jgi:hypothetical protein
MSAMSITVSRIGEAELVKGPSGSPSLEKEQNVYKVRTTPLPASHDAVNWLNYFNEQLKGPLVAYHNGNEITVYCNPDDYPDWLEKVDAAIEQANGRASQL